MTEEQVFNEITSNLKWYEGFCSQPHSVYLKKNFNNGSLKKDTIDNLFKKFGYEAKTQRTFTKIK